MQNLKRAVGPTQVRPGPTAWAPLSRADGSLGVIEARRPLRACPVGAKDLWLDRSRPTRSRPPRARPVGEEDPRVSRRSHSPTGRARGGLSEGGGDFRLATGLIHPPGKRVGVFSLWRGVGWPHVWPGQPAKPPLSRADGPLGVIEARRPLRACPVGAQELWLDRSRFTRSRPTRARPAGVCQEWGTFG
jgi:hypothetical protein